MFTEAYLLGLSEVVFTDLGIRMGSGIGRGWALQTSTQGAQGDMARECVTLA